MLGRVAAVLTAGGACVLALPAGVAVIVLQTPSASAATTVPAQYEGMVASAQAACAAMPAGLLAAQLEAESGWNPTAVSAAGAQGLAQFTPGTWSTWGRDVDGNGVASPFDPADSIDAQGRLMCSLLAQAQATPGLKGSAVELALAGYNAGWGAVLAAGGVPQNGETPAYVQRIVGMLGEESGGGASFGTGSQAVVLPRANPRTTDEAIAWARAQAGSGGWYERCLAFVASAYGWGGSGVNYAIDQYHATPGEMRHDGDRNPPAGALLFWDTGHRAGHVAIYLGDGLIASNDIEVPGQISVVPAGAIESRWGARYLGWAPPYFPSAG